MEAMQSTQIDVGLLKRIKPQRETMEIKQEAMATDLQMYVRTYRNYETLQVFDVAKDGWPRDNAVFRNYLRILERLRLIPTYIRRNEERIVLQAIRSPGTPLLLLAPHDFGKSFLLARLLLEERAQSDAPIPIQIKLGRWPATEHFQSLGTFLEQLGREALRLFQEETTKSPPTTIAPEQLVSAYEAIWSGHDAPSSKLTATFRDILLSHSRRIILCVEHLERLLSVPFRADFFSLLRSWTERCSVETVSPWSQLRLILTSTVAPDRLDEADTSPFWTMATRVDLEDLRSDQIRSWLERHDISCREADLATALTLIGGNPRLWRTLIDYVYSHGVPLAKILSDADLPLLVFKADFDRTAKRLESRPTLQAVIEQLLDGHAATCDPVLLDEIYSRGVLAGIPPAYRLRCQLFDRYLRMRWRRS
jgi:hypothetical protein